MRFVPGTSRDLYKEHVKPPKYNARVSIVALDRLNAGRYLALRLPNWSKAEHLRASTFYTEQRDRLKHQWNHVANRAAKAAFGRPFEFTDYKISGIGRDEFSERHKKQLRALAQDSSFSGDIGFAHKAAAAFVSRTRKNPSEVFTQKGGVHIDIGSHNVKRTRNPIKGPGKFEGELYVTRYAHENYDEDIGDVQELGWYGRFSGKIKGRGPFHIIVSENNQGFVWGKLYDSEKQMMKAWREVEKDYEQFYEQQEPE